MKIIIRAFLFFVVLAIASDGQDLSKFTAEGAGGVSFPVGSANNRLNTGYNFLLGAGWKFTPAISALLEFQYDRFSLNSQTLQAFNQPDGFNRYWSPHGESTLLFQPEG